MGSTAATAHAYLDAVRNGDALLLVLAGRHEPRCAPPAVDG